MLGWGGAYPDFIKAVIDVDSHHYNIFDLSRVSSSSVVSCLSDLF